MAKDAGFNAIENAKEGAAANGSAGEEQHTTREKLSTKFKKLKKKLSHNTSTSKHVQADSAAEEKVPAAYVTKDVRIMQGVEHGSGPSHTSSAALREHSKQLQHLRGQDLFIQVVSARGLPAADRNGLSDPFCKVRCGTIRHQTKVIPKTLAPKWSETFCLDMEDEDLTALSADPNLYFEVWDHDHILRNDFLGQAEVDLTKQQLEGPPIWLQLAGKAGKGDDGDDWGELEVALWLGPKGHVLGRISEDQSRLSMDSQHRPKAQLSSLVNPPGLNKSLPLVVHTGSYTLYEEPCIAYLNLHVAKAKGIRGGAGASKTVSQEQHEVQGSEGSTSSTGSSRRKGPKASESRNPKKARKMRRSETSMPRDTEVHETLSADSYDRFQAQEGGDSHSPKKGDSEGGSIEDWADDDDAHGASAEDTSMPPQQGKDDEENWSDEEGETLASAGISNVWVWLKVSMGSQSHVSRLRRATEHRTATWNQNFAFAMAVPLRNRVIKLEIWGTYDRKRQGKILAHAYIPLFSAMNSGQDPQDGTVESRHPEDSKWFRLHVENKLAADAGVIKLAVAAIDADTRRAVYKQPLASLDSGQDASLYELMPPMSPAMLPPAPCQLHLHKQATCLSPADGAPYERMPSATSSGRGGSKSQSGDLLRLPSGNSQSGPPGLDLSHSGSLAQELPVQRPPSNTVDEGDIVRQALEGTPVHKATSLRNLTALVKFTSKELPTPGSMWARLQHRLNRFQLLGASEKATKVASKVPQRPIGILKLILHGLELEESDNPFVIIKCGPHWGKTDIKFSSKSAVYEWEVHIPLYDPATLLLLAVFSTPDKVHKARIITRAVRSMWVHDATFLGKLRVRLSTLQPWEDHECHLPMLADSSKNGKKVVYWDQKALLLSYLKPDLPEGLYRFGMVEADTAKLLRREHNKIILRWLGSANPPLNAMLVKSTLDNERHEFTMARSKANWRRLKEIGSHFTQFKDYWVHLQCWEAPWESAGAVAGMAALAFYPHLVLAGCLLWVALHSLVNYRSNYLGKPAPMEEPMEEQEEESDEVASQNTGPYQNLKRKYDSMVMVALSLQNLLDDAASFLERMRACITWQDPSATLLFLAFCIAGAMLLPVIGLPTVFAVVSCYQLRPPFMRDPMPPPPVAFFSRCQVQAGEPCRSVLMHAARSGAQAVCLILLHAAGTQQRLEFACDQQLGLQTAVSATDEIATAAAEAVTIEKPSNEANPDAGMIAAQDAVNGAGTNAAQSEASKPAADGPAAESKIAQAAGETNASGAADQANTGSRELAVEEAAGDAVEPPVGAAEQSAEEAAGGTVAPAAASAQQQPAVRDTPDAFVYLPRTDIESLLKRLNKQEHIKYSEVKKERKKHLNNIFQACNANKLDLDVLSLAMTYYHRYFLTHKLAKSDPFIMAVACLHLAAKCCDRPRRISDVVEHLYRLEYGTNEYSLRKFRDPLINAEIMERAFTAERALLYAIGFEFSIKSPHSCLLACAHKYEVNQAWKASVSDDPDHIRELTQQAFNLLSFEWLQTTLCLQYPPKFLAAMMVWLCTHWHKPVGGITVQGQPLEMPLRPSGREWWEEWCPKVTLNMFFDIWHQLQAQVFKAGSAEGQAARYGGRVPGQDCMCRVCKRFYNQEHILVAKTPAEVTAATGKAAAEDMRAAQLSGDLRLEAAYLNSPHRLDSPLVPRTPHAAHSNASQGAIAAAGAAAAVSAAPEQAANQADSAAAAAQETGGVVPGGMEQAAAAAAVPSTSNPRAEQQHRQGGASAQQHRQEGGSVQQEVHGRQSGQERGLPQHQQQGRPPGERPSCLCQLAAAAGEEGAKEVCLFRGTGMLGRPRLPPGAQMGSQMGYMAPRPQHMAAYQPQMQQMGMGPYPAPPQPAQAGYNGQQQHGQQQQQQGSVPKKRPASHYAAGPVMAAKPGGSVSEGEQDAKRARQ
eukprot:jgi/Astpho2/6512/fgenesh1_pg.00099_%23_1_t